MDFFSSCKDTAEAKTLYRKLVKCFHPDVGGIPELMIELQKQYENFCSNPSSSYNPTSKMFSHFPRFDDQFYQNTNTLNERIKFLEQAIATRSSQLLLSERDNHDLRQQLNYFFDIENDCKRLKSLLPCSLWDYWKKRKAINRRLRNEK